MTVKIQNQPRFPMRDTLETFEKPLDVGGQIDRIGQDAIIENSTGHLKGLAHRQLGNRRCQLGGRSADLVCGKIDPSFRLGLDHGE
jgi:hypothetical protein